MRTNSALAAWRAGKQTLGVWLHLANALTAEALAHLGFDWVCVDLQHGLLDYTDLRTLLPAISGASATPIVRVPWNEPYEIMKALDAGAYGVIVPMVNSKAEAEQAVAACRYPPAGNRSFGPIRAALYGGPGYATEANAEIACIAMIETAEGLRNLDAILGVPGLDGIYIGPADLALALGLPAQGDTDAPVHAEAVKNIRAACERHGVPIGIHTSSVEYARRYLAQGFQFVTAGSDYGLLMSEASARIKAIQGEAMAGRDRAS